MGDGKKLKAGDKVVFRHHTSGVEVTGTFERILPKEESRYVRAEVTVCGARMRPALSGIRKVSE